MSNSSSQLIRGVWPLPGGNKRYLDTLERALKWTASQESPTKEDLARWLEENYNVGSGSVAGYVQVLTQLGVIVIDNGAVKLTSLGKKILEAEGKDKAALVAQRFLTRYLAFPEVLAVYDQADKPLHISEMVEILQPHFPRWTSDAQYEYRALWLLSLGCLRQERGRYYEITSFGHRMLADAPQPEVVVRPLPDNEQPTKKDTPERSEDAVVEGLIRELEEAATDSKHPQRLETAVAQAFSFLGFTADQLGETGETDVLVRATIGKESYSMVVDAKSRANGKLQELPVSALIEHQENNHADYVVVVANDFAGGRVDRDARNNEIVLMSVQTLSKWLRLHEQTPLNLSDYRAMFTQPGALKDLPAAVITAAEERQKWANLIVDLIALIEETYEHGLLQPLSSQQLFTMLVTRLRGVRYSRHDVKEAIALLTHPAIGAMLGDGEAGISLAMSRETLVRVLKSLAAQISTREPETEM